nr:hypothetical protein [uncultured bacterium]
MIVVAAIIHLAAWEVLKYPTARPTAKTSRLPAHPLAASVPTRPPEPTLEPEPHHDILPRADLEEVRARQRALIGPAALGWVDANHKFARIPLDQAIDMAVSNGLPTSLPATQPSTQPFMPPASAIHGPGGKP